MYLDMVGKFDETPEGYKYILTLQDGWSRFVQAYPLKKKTAEEVASTIMDKFICTFGCPQTFHSDQGKEFCNTIMKLLLQKLGVKHELAPVANPQSNLVERWHKTMEETLRTVIQGQETEWPKYLPGVVLAYNTQVHSTTGVTPFLADLILRLPTEKMREMFQRLQETCWRDIPQCMKQWLRNKPQLFAGMLGSTEIAANIKLETKCFS